jgi:hypothetical protein
MVLWLVRLVVSDRKGRELAIEVGLQQLAHVLERDPLPHDQQLEGSRRWHWTHWQCVLWHVNWPVLRSRMRRCWSRGQYAFIAARHEVLARHDRGLTVVSSEQRAQFEARLRELSADAR